MVFTPYGVFFDCGRKTPCQSRPVGVHRTSWCSPSLAPRAYSPADARRIGRMQSQTPIPHPPETHLPEPRDHHFLTMFPGMPIHEPKAERFENFHSGEYSGNAELMDYRPSSGLPSKTRTTIHVVQQYVINNYYL